MLTASKLRKYSEFVDHARMELEDFPLSEFEEEINNLEGEDLKEDLIDILEDLHRVFELLEDISWQLDDLADRLEEE